MSRKRMEDQEIQNAILMRKRKPTPKTWKGEKMIHARDANPNDIQDTLELVVVGADVEALYPNLSDIEVALICYQAVMESSITFNNINYKLARTYIAMNLSKTEQRLSPLYRVLPRRTSRGGTRPGVTAPVDKDDHWEFPDVEMTSLEKRMIVATMVQIGVITMFHTHVYSFDGELFLQNGPPVNVCSSTCCNGLLGQQMDGNNERKHCQDTGWGQVHGRHPCLSQHYKGRLEMA